MLANKLVDAGQGLARHSIAESSSSLPGRLRLTKAMRTFGDLFIVDLFVD